MATWQHLRSSTANKRPTTSLADGRIAINTNTASPGLFFKDSAGTGIVKVGPVHVGTTAPNSVPASGGSTGNYTGEQWLDTSVSPAQMKVWNGSTWVGIVADELPVSKLQDGAARQLIQTDAAGTGVEWTSNVDVPGTLDVTSTATFDSIAQHPLGTAGAPTITFTGDTNTGLYSPGADQVAISTNGAGRLFIDASGNVGVGTSTITGRLSLGASQDFVFGNQSSTGTGGTGRLVATGGEVYVQAGLAATAGSNAPIIFTGYGGVGERMRLDSSGRLGLGTSSPSNTLHVVGTGRFNVSGSNNAVIASDGGDPFFYTEQAAGLKFGTNSAVRMTINSSGSVGVGTQTPSHAFQLGNGAATGDYFARIFSNAGDVYIGQSANTLFGQATNTAAFAVQAANYPFGIGTTTAYPLIFGTNNQERARLDSSGRLGLGTSSPNLDLHVVGSSGSGAIQIGNSADSQYHYINFGGWSSSHNAWQVGRTPSGGIGPANGFYIYDLKNSATRLVIDSSGRVGIGSSAPNQLLQINSSSVDARIQITNSATGSTNSDGFHLQVNSSDVYFDNKEGGNFVFQSGANEAARIDSSRRLLVGTSTAVDTSSGCLIQVAQNDNPGAICLARNDGVITSGDELGVINFRGTETGVAPYFLSAQIACAADADWSASGDYPSRLVFSTCSDGSASPVERQRIDSDGSVFTVAVTNAHTVSTVAAAGTSGFFYQGRYSGTAGTSNSGTRSYVVWSNGNVQNTNNSYTAISDIKLKENIVDAGSQWADLKALRVRNYNLKEGQTHRQIGLVAQEVEPISPGLVYESPDRDAEGNDLGTVTKSVNYSVLYMKAVKALQEAMERIEVLEQRLTDAGIA
jgi:hypothetical protein